MVEKGAFNKSQARVSAYMFAKQAGAVKAEPFASST